MAKVIAMANQKGGVAKTTTSYNLGVGLSKYHNAKVLLIDADPQGHLTAYCGIENPDSLDWTLSTVLTDVTKDRNVDYRKIYHCEEGIDLIPGNIELGNMDVELSSALSREFILKTALSDIRDEYDYIIIDCQPSLGVLPINALSAADTVIIPVQANYLSVKGMAQLLSIIGRIKKSINKGLQIGGILFTMVEPRFNHTRKISSDIKDELGSDINVYKTFIPRSVRAAESADDSRSVYVNANGSKIAEAYRCFTEEVYRDGR